MVKSLQERSATLVEMATGAIFYYLDEVIFDEEARAKFLTAEQQGMLICVRDVLAQVDHFDQDSLAQAFARVMETTGLKFGKIGQPLRVVLTGGTASPGIYDILQIIGKERTIKRLERAIAVIDHY